MMDAVAPEIGRATRAYLEERLPRFALRDAPGGRCETDELVASGPHDSCGRPELAGRLRRLFRVHGLRYWQMLDISPLATRKELVELARGFLDIEPVTSSSASGTRRRSPLDGPAC